MQIYFITTLLVALSFYLWRENRLRAQMLARLQTDAAIHLKTEERLSCFVASAPGFFFSYRHGADNSNTMPFASCGISSLFDLNPKDVAASIAPLSMLIHGDDLKSFIEEIARSAAEQSQMRIEFRTEHAEKGLLWIESCATPILEEDGSILWHGFMHDITERKRMEQSLKERAELELRQSQFFNVAPGFFYTSVRKSDGSFAMPFASVGIRELFGLEPSDVTHSSEPITDLIHHEDRKMRLRCIEESTRNMSPFRIECRLIHPIKGLRWIEANSLPQRMHDGTMRWDGFMQDITERKLLEEQLIKREQEFRTLAENSPDVLARFDSGCRFVYVNSLFEKLLGFRLNKLQGMTPLQIEGLQDAGIFQQRIQEVIETGIPDEFEHSLVWPNGRIDWRQVNVVPEFDDMGQVLYVQMSSRNISSLWESRRCLEQSQERLRLLLAHQGSRHEQERMQLSWTMHENLLQILASMHMYASMLNAGTAANRHDALLPGLISGLNTSISLVREMAETLRPTVLNLGLSLSIEWLVDRFAELHSGMSCELEIGTDVSRLDEQSALVIFRIVQETLAFTEKYRKSANLRISLECEDAECQLTLRDTSASYHVEISDSNFFNLFGLQELVLAMGGEMIVFGAPNHGLLIEATLPVLQAAPPAVLLST